MDIAVQSSTYKSYRNSPRSKKIMDHITNWRIALFLPIYRDVISGTTISQKLRKKLVQLSLGAGV